MTALSLEPKVSNKIAQCTQTTRLNSTYKYMKLIWCRTALYRRDNTFSFEEKNTEFSAKERRTKLTKPNVSNRFGKACQTRIKTHQTV